MFIFQIILSFSHFIAFFSPAFSVCSSCARPINTADSMVNTYAWIKATSNSNPFIKILNSTEATVSEPFKAGPILADMNIRHVSTSIAMCPASILAKRRIIKANGFVKIPKNSINGIMGTGTFSHQAHPAKRYLSNKSWFQRYSRPRKYRWPIPS